MKLNSIRFKFIIIYSILMITAIGILASIFYINISNKLITIAKENSVEITSHYATDMGNIIEKHIIGLQFVASEEQVKNFEQEVIFEWIKTLRASESYLFSNNAYSNIEGELYSPDFESGEGKNCDCYLKLAQQDVPYLITGPKLNMISGAPIFSISVPIFDSEKNGVGTLEGTIEIDSLNKALDEIHLDGISYAWIADETGFIFLHPKFAYADQVNIKDLNNYGYTEVDDLIEQIMTKEKGSGEYYDTNTHTNRIVTFKTIPFSPGWKLGITTESEDVYSGNGAILSSLMISVIVILLITLIITALLTGTITKPIYTLTKAVKRSRTLEIDKIKNATWYTEIGSLAKAYNEMTDKLLMQNENLEDLVFERTNELEKTNKALLELTIRDKLTNAYNRGKIFDEIEQLKNDVDQKKIECFSMIFIDLDNFKHYNDAYGHDIGDKLLVNIVEALNEHIGERGMVGRYGGDEFVIVLPMATEFEAQIISKELIRWMQLMNGYEKLVKEWTGREIKKIPRKLKIGISSGTATYVYGCKKTTEDLLKKADSKMFEMKTRNKMNR